ncbi:hypothetical protein SAMN02745975_03785 [Geosporobacter subterraneus DSM 17957]|uniref:Uncharacterized protein n=1 Tax=Geosporobacter subterraneus DSM 17957 TaxID=1121919 RepID=A0A1M6Q831_9FIRM|nr:hypothetical protein [Geosporobacter subterraneus]SHK16412.1 hypothetical protein SAMN02745975_03785 [Geosporobacter subterraneus DSM 17957]
MKKTLARAILLSMLFMHIFSFAFGVAANSSPMAQPEKPYEKVVAKKGSWYTDRLYYDGKSNLVIGYTGTYEKTVPASEMQMNLSEKTVLTGIYIPYGGQDPGVVELIIVDSKGNVFQGFNAVPSYMGGLKEETSSEVLLRFERNLLYAFLPEIDITLPKGDYTLYLEGLLPPVDAYLVKGYNANAYEKYLDGLNQLIALEESLSPQTEKAVHISEGDESLWELWQQFVSEEGENPFDGGWALKPPQRYAPMFELEYEMSLDTILLSMWNDGKGAQPGTITVLDVSGTAIAEFKAQGASIGTVANGIWTAEPKMMLPAGVYYIHMSSPEALAYDETGEPVFYVGLSAPVDPVTNFTGTYKVWLDMYKTSTLMGPVEGKERSFFLEDYELTVLDKGAFIELIGIYEGMTFSQNCQVIERSEQQVTAGFDFRADLTGLPYKAKIAAEALVTLTKQPAGRIDINMTGTGYYSRAATKDKGADENTYDLSLHGNRVKTDLPPFVMAAIGKAGGVGNIPGPDSPYEAAAGILFPPLVGVVVSVLTNMLRPKELPIKSKGKQKERSPWAILAEALANSDEPDDDPYSIGDNEASSGYSSSETDYITTDGDSGYDADKLSDSYEQDLPYDKPKAPDESATQSSTGQRTETPAACVPEEPESMVVTTSTGGAQTLIVKDPATGGWVNAETGNPFDLEKHARDFPQQVKDYEAYKARNLQLEATGKTAMQQELDRIAKAAEADIAAIQKEIDARRREQLEREQRWKEADMEMAHKLSGYGRIIGDTVRNIGDEFVETGKDIYTAGVYVGGKIAEGGTNVVKLIADPKRLVNELGELQKIKDKMINQAINELTQLGKDIYNSPEIISNTLKGSLLTSAQIAAGIVSNVKTTVTDPQKAWQWVKDNVGIQNFENSMDPNRKLIDRITQVGIGTFKLGTSLASAGKAATAIGSKLGVAGTGAASGTAAKSTLTTGKSLVPNPKGIAPKLPISTGNNFVASADPPNMKGITNTSKKIIQNKADDFGLQVHTRPVTENAAKYIDEGTAIPKAVDMKAKTLNKFDELLGGPKNSEGLVGYYRPKWPSESQLKGMSANEISELKKQFAKRTQEYTKLSNQMIDYEMQGKYVVKNGLVVDVKTGKYITGDVDIYDITNFDGTPVNEKVKKMFLESVMKEKGSNVLHEDLISWASDDKAFNLEAKIKMIKEAAQGEKGIVTFNPLNNPTKSYSSIDTKDIDAVLNHLSDRSSKLTADQQKLLISLVVRSSKPV